LSQQRSDLLSQASQTHRFAQIHIGARFQTAFTVARHRQRGKRNDRQRAGCDVGAQSPDDVQSIQTAQSQIDNHNVWWFVARQRQPFFTRNDVRDAIAATLEIITDHCAPFSIVINQQDVIIVA
jgi:hypothetical protein